MTTSKAVKPLGRKAYGSIGHMPQSRIGSGDWHIHDGQARICCEKPRRGDSVIVTEKLDGACVSIANISGEIVSLIRSGYRAQDAVYDHLKDFAPYVDKRKEIFYGLLKPGERICGEWLSLAHGTRYDSSHLFFSPFIAFDIFRDNQRILYCEFVQRVLNACITPAFCVHDSYSPCSIEYALQKLGEYGHHGAVDPIEGAVWRVEREGQVDFLAKFVRHDKVDGKYLPEISNAAPIWNWSEEANSTALDRVG